MQKKKKNVAAISRIEYSNQTQQKEFEIGKACGIMRL